MSRGGYESWDLHRERWHQIYKPFGWEVLDGRYGLLLGGIDTAIWRINEFLQDRIDRIEERRNRCRSRDVTG